MNFDYLPCCGSELGADADPDTKQVIAKVNEELDGYTKSMLSDEIKKIKNQINNQFTTDIITYPSPYPITITNNIIAKTKLEIAGDADNNERYLIPTMDEYYGDISFYDNIFYFGKYSNGLFSKAMNDRPSTTDFASLDECRLWFNGIIGKPIYQVTDIRKLNSDQSPILKYKQLNDWEEVDIQNLGNKNSILKGLLGNNFDGDYSDRWVTLIAFTGYGAHRTHPIQKTQDHFNALFCNDNTFLSQYKVKASYEKYGAAAYFDNSYNLTEIYLSETGTSYTPESPAQQWKHAKWAWKVSLSVAVFLVDMIAHSRFREGSGLIKAIQESLGMNHPIRRLLQPFILGTVYCNRVFNEYFKEKGLYARAFGFEYLELCRLISDSMTTAPPAEKKKPRQMSDRMKYRFRLCRKKVAVMKAMPKQVYPLYLDVYSYWTETLSFVSEYISIYYNSEPKDDTLLTSDTELVNFYNLLLKYLDIDKKYRLKKFNLVNIISHFICNSSIWNGHLSSSISFNYSCDYDFTGLKIQRNNSKSNNILNYVEYCLVVISKGLNQSNISNNTWNKVLLNDDKLTKTTDVFTKYFVNDMRNLNRNIDTENAKERIATYNSSNPQFLQSSIML